METKDLCSLVLAVTSLVVSIIVLIINTKRFKKQLIHGVNKDWFLTFSQLVGEISTLRGVWNECHKYITNSSSSAPTHFDKMGEAKSKLYSNMYMMEIFLNESQEEDRKLIENILRYFDEKSNLSELDKLDFILEDVIKPASQIAKRTKRGLYAENDKI